jgi:NAD(P)-dependent dehydrogenase (short-subunit alcohol dehydrogenase family)
MAKPLDGRHVVITGGSGGLGVAVVEAFVAAGAVCHLPQRGAASAPSRPSIETRPNVDLSNEQSVTTYYAALPSLWASVHLAGGYSGKPFTETSLAALHEQLDLNLATAFLCCREAVRALSKSGGGRIVNVCSKAALVPGGGSIAYAAAKAAVAALTQSLAEEVKGGSILVNAVAPSTIDTPANRAAMPKANHALWPKPTEVAAAILWLASPDNRLTSGTILPVYGAA